MDGPNEQRPEEYEGILDGIDRLEGYERVCVSIAYLASQVEMAKIPEEAKKPFYAAMEALCRDGPPNHKGLSKLADFYASKLTQQKAE